jgi:hypothetical protein
MQINFTHSATKLCLAKDTKTGFIYRRTGESANGCFYIRFNHCPVVNNILYGTSFAGWIHFLNVGNKTVDNREPLDGAIISENEQMELVGELKIGVV